MTRIRSCACRVLVCEGGSRDRPFDVGGEVPEPARPLLVFLTSRRSGPARRMESLLAHIARKERDSLRVKRVDVDERPALADRFRVSEVPSLVLVKGRRVVGRLDGRSTAPEIEALLDRHLRAEPATA